MTLYEIRNGYVGESYCRAYCWAKDEQEAVRLYNEKNPKSPGTIVIRPLLDDTTPSFCTSVSSSGWETEDST